MRPEIWDGFGFYLDSDTHEVKFYYFDDLAKEYGQLPNTVPPPPDRETYHVLLSSTRKGKIHLEHPFTSSFIDAFVYAKQVALSGFTGIMIRENKYSMALLAQSFLEIMTFHITKGFWLDDEKGVPVFYEKAKEEK